MIMFNDVKGVSLISIKNEKHYASNMVYTVLIFDVSRLRRGLFPKDYTEICKAIKPAVSAMFPFSQNIHDRGWEDAACKTVSFGVVFNIVDKTKYDQGRNKMNKIFDYPTVEPEEAEP